MEPGAQEQLEAAAGGEVALPPEFLGSFYQSLEAELGRALPGGEVVLLASGSVRPYLARIVQRVANKVPVLSYNEITDEAQVLSVGMVSADAS